MLISSPVSYTYVIKLILSLNWLEFTVCNNVGTGEKLLAFLLFSQDAYGRFSQSFGLHLLGAPRHETLFNISFLCLLVFTF